LDVAFFLIFQNCLRRIHHFVAESVMKPKPMRTWLRKASICTWEAN